MDKIEISSSVELCKELKNSNKVNILSELYQRLYQESTNTKHNIILNNYDYNLVFTFKINANIREFFEMIHTYVIFRKKHLCTSTTIFIKNVTDYDFLDLVSEVIIRNNHIKCHINTYKNVQFQYTDNELFKKAVNIIFTKCTKVRIHILESSILDYIEENIIYDLQNTIICHFYKKSGLQKLYCSVRKLRFVTESKYERKSKNGAESFWKLIMNNRKNRTNTEKNTLIDYKLKDLIFPNLETLNIEYYGNDFEDFLNIEQDDLSVFLEKNQTIQKMYMWYMDEIYCKVLVNNTSIIKLNIARTRKICVWTLLSQNYCIQSLHAHYCMRNHNENIINYKINNNYLQLSVSKSFFNSEEPIIHSKIISMTFIWGGFVNTTISKTHKLKEWMTQYPTSLSLALYIYHSCGIYNPIIKTHMTLEYLLSEKENSITKFPLHKKYTIGY